MSRSSRQNAELALRLCPPLVDATSPPPDRLLSLIVPVLDEQDTIDPFLEAIGRSLTELPARIEVEIVFVDDGSTDATAHVIRSRMANDRRLRMVALSRNFGKEAALAAGLNHARGDAAIPIDADLQDPPELIPDMVGRWLDGAMVVNARRVDRSGDGCGKRLSAKLYYKVFNTLAERPIPADVGDFRLLDRQVMTVINALPEKSRFNKGLFDWAGFEVEEVTFERRDRRSGDSKWGYWKLWKLGLDGIFSSSTVPLRVWGYLGAFLAVLSFLYATMIFVTTLARGSDSPGYPSTVILILMFGGLNMLSIGILGEYVGRIYREVQNRPLYVVRSIFEPGEEL